MSTYRVYCFDGSGRIIQAESIQAADDDGALEAARILLDCPRIEIWQRDRLIGRIDR